MISYFLTTNTILNDVYHLKFPNIYVLLELLVKNKGLSNLMIRWNKLYGDVPSELKMNYKTKKNNE